MPLFWLSLTFIAGIILSSAITVPDWVMPILSIAGVLGSWLEIKRYPPESHLLLSRPLFRISFCSLLMAIILGGWRYQSAQPNFTLQDLAWYSSCGETAITGTVASFPEESPSGTVAIVQAESIRISDREIPVRGKLELRLPGGFNLSYGEVLLLEGELKPVLDDDKPPAVSYLARKGIYNRMQYPQISTIAYNAGNPCIAAIYRLRERALEIIYDQFPYPESALLSGILLGIDWVIPDHLQDAYRACGLLHIIAISGFNIALISSVIIRLTKRVFTPLKANIAAITVITIYTLLVGAEPAVVRAAIMGSMAIPARYIGRRVIALHSLTIVAAIMLAGNPFLLWDISFRLSFLACLGLITMVDILQKWASKPITTMFSEQFCQWVMPLISMVTTTLAAQFSVLPVSLNLDANLSLLSLPANLALLPVQPAIMVMGGLSVIFGFISPLLGNFLAQLTWPFLAYCNHTALYFGFQAIGTDPANLPHPLYQKFITVIVLLTLSVFSILQIHSLTASKRHGNR